MVVYSHRLIKKKLSAYDSGIRIGGSHKKPNEIIKTSLESITGQNWQTEQVQIPQQDEGESCGYRMLSYLNKVTQGQIIPHERAKDRNRLYFYLEIAQTLKDNQIKRKQKRKRKIRGKGRVEEEAEEQQQQQQQQKDENRKKKRKGKKIERK